jgi:hypothetical protein
LEDGTVDLGGGVTLKQTRARFLTPLTLENLDRTAHDTGRKPAYWQFSAAPIDVSAEICLPASDSIKLSEQIERATVIVLTIRLWCDPSVTMPVFADRSFSLLSSMEDNDGAIVRPLEATPRYFQLMPANRDGMTERLEWVRDNWAKAEKLYQQSQEFRIAADAINSGQFIRNDALALISLWGALEALFSPATSELRFRVSALIAAYLERPGATRLEKQREIAALYDKRSAAAHGKPRHSGEDLLKTFELIRAVMLKMIREQTVPSKQHLESRLFGAS